LQNVKLSVERLTFDENETSQEKQVYMSGFFFMYGSKEYDCSILAKIQQLFFFLFSFQISAVNYNHYFRMFIIAEYCFILQPLGINLPTQTE